MMSLILPATIIGPSFGPQLEKDLHFPIGPMIARIIMNIKSIVYIFGNPDLYTSGMMESAAQRWVSFVRITRI